MSRAHGLGREGEDRAAEYLLSLGYCIVTRNYRKRGGEIDVICVDGETLVFVEVKARAASGYLPEEAIGEAKIARMERMADQYKRIMEDSRDHRFDVVAIDQDGLRHHRHILNS